MHLLSAERASGDDLEEAIDLEQTPGDIVILSAAETELACFAAAAAALDTGHSSLRLANLLQLGHPMSADIYIENTIQHAKLVLLRLLGGRSYWPHGLEQTVLACAQRSIPLIVLPGDGREDDDLERISSVDPKARARIWAYLQAGGIANARNCLCYLSTLIGKDAEWLEPYPLMQAGIYWPGMADPSLERLTRDWRRPVAAVVFYRALYQAGQCDVVDHMIEALDRAGLEALPIFVSSLKDPAAGAIAAQLIAEAAVDIVLNATGFAVGRRPSALEASDAPVLQIVMASGSEANWRDGLTGLGPRDLAMHVVLPEIDGRVLSRAVSFKGDVVLDDRTQIRLSRYVPVLDRVRFVSELAAAWTRLRRKQPRARRVAIVLANYPTRDGRLANGVGLDTPASVVEILRAFMAEGYLLDRLPADGNQLIAWLQEGVTNQAAEDRIVRHRLAAKDYRRFFDQLPAASRRQILDQWGEPPPTDFPLAILQNGNVAIALQPARGYDEDPDKTYHSPDLVPTHAYLAFYRWLRTEFAADAIIHAGKHGNLEWLPGKATALSDLCWPEIAFGPLPHLYPFIVNDPGEGSQAKRRSQAVIIGHLTPPMTRAETYRDLVDLERLIDEFYEAVGLDPRRTELLRAQILAESQRIGLDRDLGFDEALGGEERLQQLDNHLCEIKEMQIRDGLHILGQSPKDAQRRDLLCALLRLPRGIDEDRSASILRALARDLELGFDPLDCELARIWQGPRPAALRTVTAAPWRSHGDTVERLELYASALIEGSVAAADDWPATQAVLIDAEEIATALDRSGQCEIESLLAGLDGRFVEPGPSGAPTRGRPDVLPTGRNFFSIDSRALPTPVAWQIGWKSASRIIDLYTQTHGDWPRRVGLSAWGTANMRTGGDDLAQTLALIGARPVWDRQSGRVTGIEVIPLGALGRPRVDVTLRISGFFRDAFPAQIALIDDAMRKIASLEEPEEMNPLAAAARAERRQLEQQGLAPATAARLATLRIYGSKPGAYGAGLQALIDSGNWTDDGDLAEAYLAWGSFAYGRTLDGEAQRESLVKRLKDIELVLHNQDNREHDILDSDDYYQFEGGMAAAIRAIGGKTPTIYHNDHSRPENPIIRPLKHEIAQIVRGRAANPKWIAGVMRHGYKGAFEMAATLDYLFAFAATTRMVENHHFDQLYDAYFGDETVRDFIESNNPAALNEMAARFDEAISRGLWRPSRNSVRLTLERPASSRQTNQ